MQEHIDKVYHLSQQPIGGPSQLPRRVHVYAALFPEYDEPTGARFFKQYMKVGFVRIIGYADGISPS